MAHKNPSSPSITRLISVQLSKVEIPAAIFTDLDGTFVVTGSNKAAKAADVILSRAKNENWPLIAITGRSTDDLLRDTKSGKLPQFDVLVGAVGTEIFLLSGGSYHRDEEYAGILNANFSRDYVVEIANRIAASLSSDGIQIKPQEKPPEPYKYSMLFTADTDETIAQVTDSFRKAFPRLKVIVCEEIYYNAANSGPAKKYNLDIVPAQKSDAIRYLMRKYKIKRGIVAGDSGNDIDALLVPGLTAVLVSGHQAKTRDALSGHYPNIAHGEFGKTKDKHVLIDTHPQRTGPESILLAMNHLKSIEPPSK